MDRLINVFIGSSSESLDIANKLKQSLEDLGGMKCEVWDAGLRKFNKLCLDILTHASYAFDFGIMIASKDDVAIIRACTKEIPRDNVIFEYGLFLGAMGNSRTFLVQEEGVCLPTDLLGYTTPRFNSKFSKDQWGVLSKDLHAAISEEQAKSNIQVLPSTSLAIGYFDSFLKKVCRYIQEKEKPLLNKNQFDHTDVKVRIIIPKELSSDIGAKARLFFRENNYTFDEIGDKTRPFPIRFFKKADDLLIVDIPTTLNAIRPAVNLLMDTKSIGFDNEKSRIERKELENFKKALQYLISQDDYAKNLVEVKWESE